MERLAMALAPGEARKDLSADALFGSLRSRFASLPDLRSGEVEIPLADALMSAFAMFSLKDPSLLAFDHRRHNPKDNFRTIYGINRVPCDSQMRDILDPALSTRHQLHYHGSRQWITSLHITEARMYQPLCTRASARACANAHAHARRSKSFHRLETLLAQRRFQRIPMEILPHCAAMPLGVMVRGIMESLLDAEALEKLFQEYAPQQYTLELAIDALVSLLIQVSAGHRASVFAAYTADQASMPPTISTSYQALYAKLGRMDPKLSEAIVRFCAEKLRPVLEKLPRAAAPILAGYRTQILDGNVLTGTDHRLTALRQWLNACLPGKSLVVFEPDLGLISDLVLCEDAYTQERALLTYILERVQAQDLLVFDRNFTTTGFAFGIAERGGSFVGRQHRTNLPVQPVSKLVKCGETETGRIYEQIVRPPIQTPARRCSCGASRSASSRRRAMARRQLDS